VTKWISTEKTKAPLAIDVWIWPFEDEPGYSVNACVGCRYDFGWQSACGENIEDPTHYAEIDYPEPPEEAK